MNIRRVLVETSRSMQRVSDSKNPVSRPRCRMPARIVSFVALCSAASAANAQVDLGTARNFAVLGGSTVTSTGPTVVTGNLGVSPGTAVTGFPPGIVTGSIHAGDATAAQAKADLAAAFNTAAGLACGVDLSGQDLGGLTLTPNVYCFASGAGLDGTLTLDMQGNANATFVFKIGSTLTTGAASSVVLTNSGGASCAPNVYWHLGTSATIGVGSALLGSVLAQASITTTTGAALSGNALAMNGAVTLDTNSVAVCTIATPVRLQEFHVN